MNGQDLHTESLTNSTYKAAHDLSEPTYGKLYTTNIQSHT
jgi:hypothetical protein